MHLMNFQVGFAMVKNLIKSQYTKLLLVFFQRLRPPELVVILFHLRIAKFSLYPPPLTVQSKLVYRLYRKCTQPRRWCTQLGAPMQKLYFDSMKCIKKINFEIGLQTKNILIIYIIFSQILMQSWLWILSVACPGSFVHAEKNSHLTVVIILTCGYNFKENQLYKYPTFLARNGSRVYVSQICRIFCT